MRGKSSRIEKKVFNFNLRQKKIRFLFLFMMLEALKKLRVGAKLRKIKKGKFTERAPEYLAKKQKQVYTYQFFKKHIAFSILDIQD